MLYGQGKKWSADPDILEDIVFIYRGDNEFVPTDVGTYYFLSYLQIFFFFFDYYFFFLSLIEYQIYAKHKVVSKSYFI